VASIFSLNISPGGVPKLSVEESRVTVAGLTGDWQKNRKYHGGPERALCLYALERIEALAVEGHRVGPGSLGENVTVAGLAWDEVVPGVRLRLGRDVVVEVTSFTEPCRTIAGVFADGRPVRVSQPHHPGWSRVYARVLGEGVIRRGDPIALEQGREG
jgi:MOSC domain-containing protein YiiM